MLRAHHSLPAAGYAMLATIINFWLIQKGTEMVLILSSPNYIPFLSIFLTATVQDSTGVHQKIRPSYQRRCN